MDAAELDSDLRAAIRHFWATRQKQSDSQGAKSGQKDSGQRTSVTGGRHLDGFTQLCRNIFLRCGVPDAQVFTRGKLELPGYYRPEKNWDLVVVSKDRLVAVVEFKAQIGPSFGNNFNNRTEEALGNATDIWAAYREGAFKPSPRPWLGFVFLLEDCEASRKPVSVSEPHYKVFDEFRDASYAKRYELMLLKLLRDRLYDGTSLLLIPKDSPGDYACPNEEISFQAFSTALHAHALACAFK